MNAIVDARVVIPRNTRGRSMILLAERMGVALGFGGVRTMLHVINRRATATVLGELKRNQFRNGNLIRKIK